MKPFITGALALALLTGTALAQTSTTDQPSPQPPAVKQDPSTVAPSAGQPGTGQATGTMQQTAPAGSARIDYYTIQPADMRASKLIGAVVFNQSNERIGEVDDLVISNGNTIQALVLGVGGFLGVGERKVAIKPGAAVVTEMENRSVQIVVNATKDELKNAPVVNTADLDAPGTIGTKAKQ
jgi:sporulation protein YlmC with PRC-barrel domain